MVESNKKRIRHDYVKLQSRVHNKVTASKDQNLSLDRGTYRTHLNELGMNILRVALCKNFP